MTKKTIVLLGCFDTKDEAYGWLRDRIRSTGVKTLMVDISVAAEPTIKPDIPAADIALAAGYNLTDRERSRRSRQRDRGDGERRPSCSRSFYAGKLHGIIGLGGSGGTSAITEVMREFADRRAEVDGVDSRQRKHPAVRRRNRHRDDVPASRYCRAER